MAADPSPALPLQAALYALFTGDAFQAACGVTVGVYDRTPATARTPYIVLSDIQVDGAQAQNYDASEIHANIVVWSTRPGKVEAQRIAGQVRAFTAPRVDPPNARTPPFTLEGHRLVTWRFLQAVPMDDPDGISSKVIVRLEYGAEPTP